MQEPLNADRLVWGGSLYPPPDVPQHYSRRLSVLVIVIAAVAAWALVVALVYPVLL